MSWLSKNKQSRILTAESAGQNKKGVPEGVWSQCPSCSQPLFQPELVRNLMVCPNCNHHHRTGARNRIQWFLDAEGQSEIGANILPVDMLKFKDTKKYEERLKQAQEKTGEKDAMVVVKGTVKKIPVVVSAFEFDFLGGSMGSVVGERFANIVQREICARTDLVNCHTHAKSWDLLRLTKAPAVRIDLGYLTNSGDLSRLSRPDFRDVIAEALVIAIQRLYLAAEDDAKTGTLRLSDLRSAGIRR